MPNHLPEPMDANRICFTPEGLRANAPMRRLVERLKVLGESYTNIVLGDQLGLNEHLGLNKQLGLGKLLALSHHLGLRDYR